MKEIDELIINDDLRYTEDHEWARAEGDIVRIGINDYAQDQLGDIVYVDITEAGTKLEKGEEFGTVESVKAVSELYMPVSGTIIEVNTILEDSPEMVNQEPYDGGWMLKVDPDNITEMDQLMDKESYIDMLKGA